MTHGQALCRGRRARLFFFPVQIMSADQIHIELAIETARKLSRLDPRKFREKELTSLVGCIKPLIEMANEPALDKVILSFQIPASLDIRLRKEAERRGMSKSALIDFLLFEATKDVPLSAEDYEQIAQVVRKNEEKRQKKRVG